MRARTIAVLSAVAAATATALPATALPARSSAAGAVTVIASGLNNPRGLTWAHGRLWLAEAGRGGTDCPAGVLGPDGSPTCYGPTASIDIVGPHKVQRVVRGLISFAGPGGVAAEGVEAVAPAAKGVLAVFGESVVGTFTEFPETSFLTPADDTIARAELGRLAVTSGHRVKVLSDVGDSDYAWTAVHLNLVPDQYPDANPNAVLGVGNTTYVADAGANTLDSVDAAGNVKQLAFIPNNGKSDGVPTCLAAAPNGLIYIGELAPGAPTNGSKIYSYNPKTKRLKVWKTGFNVVDGCGFDATGNFYVVELQAHGFNPGPDGDPSGDVIRIAKNGKRTVLGAGKLFFPQGFATDGKHHIYVSNWSIMPGTPLAPGGPTGQVVRIDV